MLENLQKPLTRQHIALQNEEVVSQRIKSKSAPGWSTNSWHSKRSEQLPSWTDRDMVEKVLAELSALPPLVTQKEIVSLKGYLARVGRGEAFLLQGGACSERFADAQSEKVKNKVKLLSQMSSIISLAMAKPVVTIGRIAGQFAKPRSANYEEINGEKYLSYRGDIVNDTSLDHVARAHDPERMLKGYASAAITLNSLRGLYNGGYYSLESIAGWHDEVVSETHMSSQYGGLLRYLTYRFNSLLMPGVERENSYFNESAIFTSHEALVLPYEESLTRSCADDSSKYDQSGHMLWIGERTRQLDGAHVEFMRGVANPIGVKIGPGYEIENIIALCKKLNHDNTMGKLSLITRFGNDEIHTFLPPLIKAVTAKELNVVWICDPVHGNTYSTENGVKTRKIHDIKGEVGTFFSIHKDHGSVAGGIHLELSADNVTECIDDHGGVTESDLANRYRSSCDPRLNRTQSLEVALWVALNYKNR